MRAYEGSARNAGRQIDGGGERMLTQLHIKNIAVIDESDVEFGSGLNVLTGETGAGKSIVIDSINMILGERGGRGLVRHGCDSALIQASFETRSKKALELAEDYDACDDDGGIVLTRKISESGKNVCRLNGALVTSAALKELGAHLIDIHGQHDNQKLLTPAKHIDFLDGFAGEKAETAKSKYIQKYTEYTNLKKRLEELENGEEKRLERIEFLRFRCDELEKAVLREGEEEELLAQEKLLANAEEIIRALSEAYTVLYDGEFTVYDALSSASGRVSDAAAYDEEMEETASELSDILYRVGDIASAVRSKRDSLDFDPERLIEVQERLALISSLKRKYGGEVSDILAQYEKMSGELDSLTDGGENAESVRMRLGECEKELEERAKNLTQVRMSAKERLEKLVERELGDLDMERVKFEVFAEQGQYCANGRDSVEFMIATNPGEPLKPLSKIASGGELSRIMLALKTVLADSDDVETLIFDEIDTGVSGRAAGKIAAKLCKIAKRRQVICITHLAQIACAADSHYLIKKETDEKSSSTHIELLDERQRAEELSRILGGLTVTETTRTHARELLHEAAAMKADL